MKKLLPTRYSLLTNSTGFSQVEIVITILIISIVILGIITTFSTIGKGLITGKTRTIANNLAQEKIEVLKNVSYSRLLTTSQDDLTTYGYDYTNTDYTPETLNVGDANYIRRTTVWKAEETGTDISTMSPTATDQGIKKIKIEILWTENNEQKSLVLYNLRDDPNRTTMGGKIYGIITTTNSVGISAARVEIIQDINRNDTTSTTGYYIIKTTSPATLQINVSKDGYWSKTSVNTDVSAAANLSLTAKEKGNAYGFVYKRDHLVISEICAALSEDTTEYVELYNPTTYTITVDGNYKLKYVDNSNNVSNFTLLFVNSSVDSHKYFLIARYGSVGGVAADATFTPDKMPVADNKGGVGLLTTYDVWVDSIGWGPGASAPANAVEGAGFTAGTIFGTNDSIERLSYSTYTAANMAADTTNGNAWDTNNNSADWILHEDDVTNPQNSSMSSETPVCGTPVGQAVVSANDGLSSAVSADSTGYYYLTGIATGTLTLYGSSLTLSGVEPNTLITTGGKTNRDIILSSTSEGGFISGYVKGPAAGVANITVSAGGYTATTSASPSGYYSFSVDVGSYTVIANPDYTSVPDGADWTSGTSQAEANETVEVNYGESVLVGDLIIRSAGWISGTTFNASGGNLPYITIRTTSPITGFSTDVVSGTDGTYIIKGAKTSTDYDLYPVLDDADTYSRTGAWGTWTTPVTVTQGVETTGKHFKITSAWGKIIGTVSDTAIGGNIKTGVLIIATTAAMPADSPPTISGGTVGGTTTIYYGTISNSSGNYEVQVRKGWTYNLKAWYTKISGDTVAVQPTKTGTLIFGVSDSSATVSFPWP